MGYPMFHWEVISISLGKSCILVDIKKMGMPMGQGLSNNTTKKQHPNSTLSKLMPIAFAATRKVAPYSKPRLFLSILVIPTFIRC